MDKSRQNNDWQDGWNCADRRCCPSPENKLFPFPFDAIYFVFSMFGISLFTETLFQEVCVDVVPSAVNAVRGGARRLELCSSLGADGLTPSVGFVKVVQEMVPLDCRLFVMIRPRPQDFIYTDSELRIMLEDIRVFKEKGVDGFVFGCLTASGEVHAEHCEKLLAEARPLPCTFHRAFDIVTHPLRSLSIIENLGFARILTSGQEENAFLGKDLIRNLVEECDSRGFKVNIMPGGGIDAENLAAILEHTGVREFHGSAKSKTAKSGMYLTDEENVRQMVSIGEKYGCRYG